jgi:F0F1-type ATP synthase membrane subunit b/b'
MEDLRVDTGSDGDYNDIVFQVRGATGKAALLDEVIVPGKDWRNTDMGQALITYAEPYITPDASDDGGLVADGSVADFVDGTDSLGNGGEVVTEPITNESVEESGVVGHTTDVSVDGGLDESEVVLGSTADVPVAESGVVEEPINDIDEINDEVAQWVVGDIDSENWTQSLIEYVDDARESGQQNVVVNLSLNLTEVNADGAVIPRYELTEAEWNALAYAQQHNVLVVVPAGDDGETMSALGQASLEFDNIITVGAAEQVNDSVPAWKTYDVADNSGNGYALDMVANGSNGEIVSTSVAASKIADAAEQVWAVNPKLSYRQVIDILQRTATDLKTPNWDLETGAGLLNLVAAVHLAKVTSPIDTDVPVRWLDFAKANQPLIGIIDTGFIAKNPDIDYQRIILGRDHVDNDNNPLLETGEGNEHGTHVLGIIGATQGNGIGIDGMNDDAPIWLGRAVGSGNWAESLREFVDAAKASSQPNAVVNLSFDLTQVNPDGSVTTRYELTPQEREALEYARQNGVMVVVAAGNDGGTMSALGQASQEFDNIITVGSIDYNGNRAEYSSFGYGLDFVARGGTPNEQVISTVGEGAALNLLTSDEEPPEDEMSANARSAFEEAFGSFSDTEEIDEAELENLTPKERQVYEEATKEIDQLLKDYLDAASQKMALEYVDGYYGTQVDALSKFVDAFDENAGDILIKAQEILGEAGLSADIPTETNLDFSIPLDLGIGGMAGTSVAAAKLTGAVSQVWAANPGLSYPQVKEILSQTAVDFGKPGWDLETGSGLVDVAAAVELAKRTQPQAYQPKPIQSPLTWSGDGKVTPSERAVAVSVPPFAGRVMDAGYVSTLGFQRVRSGPGTNFAQVEVKYPGEAVTFDAYEDNGGWYNDPYVGGSRRWYRIAGTDHWMWALYIDNTPEQAEQERQRQEAIRQAEEDARRAEEELRRAEEEARQAEEELRRIEEEARQQAEEEARRRIEEELQRILEEQRRQQEQLQAAIGQVSQKVGDLGTQLGSYISNGVQVYLFDKGNLLIQPDGRYGFYEISKEVGEFFDPNKEGSFGNYIWNPKYPSWVNVANNVSRGIDNADRIEQLGKFLAYPGFSNSMNGFVLHPPRFGNYSQYIDNSFSFFNSQLKNWDEFVGGKTFTNPGKNGFIFKTPGVLPTGTSWLGKSGAIGPLLGLVPTAWEYWQAKTDEERGKALIKGGAGILGGIAGTSIGAALFAPVLPPAGSIVGGIVGGLVGGYLGEKAGEWVGNNWQPITQNLQNGWNAATSTLNSAIEAAKATAQAAKEKAQAAAEKAKEAYQTAKATVQQAQAAYQTFKQEVQKHTTQIVQQSQQKIKEETQKIYNKVVQNPVVQAGSAVVNHVANYANKAVKAVSNIINGGKQFVSNVIETGKQFVNNIIDTGKQAYETVKNVVVNTYETGKQVVTETFNNAVNTVTNTFSGGFNQMKSFLGW